MTIRAFAVQQIAQRLGRVAFESRRVRKSPGDDAVHDLRVSIRRFSQAVRVFSRLLPEAPARKIRKRLRAIMKLAGEVRNLDIAAELITASRLEGSRPLAQQLAADRKEAARHLVEALRQLNQRDFSTRWRERLELDI
jgi:CHAD domain-containing protein